MDLESYLNRVKQNIKKISDCQDINQHLDLYKNNKQNLEKCNQIINHKVDFNDTEKKYQDFNLFQIKEELEKINDKMNDSENFSEIEELYSIAIFLKNKSKNKIKDLKISIQYV